MNADRHREEPIVPSTGRSAHFVGADGAPWILATGLIGSVFYSRIGLGPFAAKSPSFLRRKTHASMEIRIVGASAYCVGCQSRGGMSLWHLEQ